MTFRSALPSAHQPQSGETGADENQRGWLGDVHIRLDADRAVKENALPVLLGYQGRHVLQRPSLLQAELGTLRAQCPNQRIGRGIGRKEEAVAADMVGIAGVAVGWMVEQ